MFRASLDASNHNKKEEFHAAQVQQHLCLPAGRIVEVALNSRHRTLHTRYFEVHEADRAEDAWVRAYPTIVISSLYLKIDKSHQYICIFEFNHYNNELN